MPAPTTSYPATTDRRPADDELDMFGLTHPGLKRAENQDHFLLAMVRPKIDVLWTSLPDTDALPLEGTRLGTILLVADGVGGATDGGAAALLATQTITQYVSSTFRSYHAIRSGYDEELEKALAQAALQAHDAVRAEAATRGDHAHLATTLTLGIGVWPWLYVVQVGDSRAYIHTQGALRRITRDQTLAQALLDVGVLKPTDPAVRHYEHVLASAIGAEEALPVVSRVDVSERGCVLLFCSDGLTKHVTDDEIAAMCRDMTSAESLSRELLQLALDRGGSDNITIIVARAPLRRSRSSQGK